MSYFQYFLVVLTLLTHTVLPFCLTHDDINHPKYAWMDELVEKELAPFAREGIWQMWVQELKKSPCKELGFYRIKHGIFEGTGSLNPLIEKLHRELGLPDMEFIFFEGAGVTSQEQIPKSRAPILAGTKIKGMEQVILFCDPFFHCRSNDTHNWSATYDKILKLNQKLAWDDKIDMLIWRGANTGVNALYSVDNWRQLKRGALIDMSQVYPYLLDAGFSHIHPWKTKNIEQFKREVRIDGRMNLKEQHRYKYQIAIDGDSCSYPGIQWRLLSNSLLFLPQSQLITWYMPALQEGVHYIGIHEDYSDLPSKIEWARDNDLLAQRIAIQGTQFAKNKMGEKQIAIYCYKILKYYAKLYKSRI